MKHVVTMTFVAIALAGCGQKDTTAHQEASSGSDEHALHWGYEGDEGPEHWGSLDSSFSTCSSGAEQSPIDITGAEPMADSGLRRQIGDTVLTGGQRTNVLDIVDNGHTIQVANDLPVTMWLDDAQYELVQYHFHAPSEHTIDGQHAVLEAHFVHKSAEGNLAVLGVLVEEGEHDARWDPILSQLPDGPGDSRHIEGVDIDLNKLRSLPNRYYRYEGSLTTPPCSEGVSWVVVADRHQMSPDQLRSLSSRMPKNNRPVQSLGERTIGLVSHED
jgi:carbonic anhydrase